MEYIIFNEPEIVSRIIRDGAYNLGEVSKDIIYDLYDSYEREYDESDYFYEMAERIEIDNNVPENWAEWLYKTLTEKRLLDIFNYNRNEKDIMLIIYDYKMRQVLPIRDEDFTARYFQKWFPQ